MPTPLIPRYGRNVFIASTAYVGGDVELGDFCTVMHHVVIRGDIARISIGERVNVQDGSILHTSRGIPLEIANGVGIGHRAVVHCRKIGTRSLIATGAIVLDECEIGKECLIAAGSLLPPRTRIPDGSVVMGSPGRVVRSVTPQDLALIDHVVNSYVELGQAHLANKFPNLGSISSNSMTGG